MDTTEKQPALNILVLGATGSIGYAVTANLLLRRLPVTILVRNRAKASALFTEASTLTIVEGDVQDAALLNRVARNVTHIVHAINYPYDQWFGNMDTVTQKVIDAAAQNGATIIFPGNIYNFGNTKELIREDSRPNPITRKGKLRVEIEAMLERAANTTQGQPIRVLNIRLPDFWGPNVLNAAVAPIFEGALKGKALPWLLNVDIPHQSVYTPDAAEVIVQLLLRDASWPSTAPYEVWNYGGTTLPSMRWLFKCISAVTGNPLRVQVHSRFIIGALGLFMPIMREVKEMLYLYENTVLLDDSKVRTTFPDFHETPIDLAVTNTLSWFAKNQLKRPFTPLSATSSSALTY